MPKFNPNPTKLEKARRAAKISRKKLAELSGMSFSTLKSCEQRLRCINNAKAKDVIRIADILNVHPRDILEDEE